jgi:hypothetical protein
MPTQAVREQSVRSTFVSVLAWVFIVLAGFSTFISVLQNVMINTMFSSHAMPTLTGPDAEQTPAFFRFMLGHMELFFLAFLVVSSGTLIAAVGLLRRKNWARLAFVGILALGIAWNIAGLVLQQTMFSSMPAVPSSAPPDFRAEFDRMATVMQAFSIVMALGISALFVWLIKRLLSKATRAEFTHAL